MSLNMESIPMVLPFAELSPRLVASWSMPALVSSDFSIEPLILKIGWVTPGINNAREISKIITVKMRFFDKRNT